MYSSTTSVVLQQKQHKQHPTHGRTDPPSLYSSAAARAAAVRKNVMQRLFAESLCFYDAPRRRVLTTLPACRVRLWDVQQYYSSGTAAEAARTAPDPPTHPPRNPPCTPAQQDVQQQYVSSFMQTLCCLHRIGISCVFSVFLRSPAISGPGTAPVDAPRL